MRKDTKIKATRQNNFSKTRCSQSNRTRIKRIGDDFFVLSSVHRYSSLFPLFFAFFFCWFIQQHVLASWQKQSGRELFCTYTRLNNSVALHISLLDNIGTVYTFLYDVYYRARALCDCEVFFSFFLVTECQFFNLKKRGT